jgi:hypothetical protein
VLLVELSERVFEGELAASNLQALDKIAGAGNRHTPAVLDERETDRCRQMTLAAAGEQEQIGPSRASCRRRSAP